MDSQAVFKLAERIESHLHEHILPFWCGPALDAEHGGWQAWMTNDLRVDHTKPKGLIVNARILWAFSAVHQTRPGPLYGQMAARAYDLIFNHFWDVRHGGAVWRLDGDGKVLDDSKKIYGQAFCIYALAEYYRAFGDKAALDRAIELFHLVESAAHDPVHGGYVEVCRRDWSQASDNRLSEKDMDEKKSMNNHLHVLEAYTNLWRVWPHPLVAGRLRELITLFLERILNSQTHHLNHFFDEQWRVRSDTYTFGHDIEGSWLLCEAAESLGDAGLLAAVREVAAAMAAAVRREGIDATGALCYEGRQGRVIDAGKECWPQAEAVVGFINALQITGDPVYFHTAGKVWNFIETRLADAVHGEWFWRITPEGQPDLALPKVSEWKGPYHGTRGCLEAAHRLRLPVNPVHPAPRPEAHQPSLNDSTP